MNKFDYGPDPHEASDAIPIDPKQGLISNQIPTDTVCVAEQVPTGYSPMSSHDYAPPIGGFEENEVPLYPALYEAKGEWQLPGPMMIEAPPITYEVEQIPPGPFSNRSDIPTNDPWPPGGYDAIYNKTENVPPGPMLRCSSGTVEITGLRTAYREQQSTS